ncbi:hypothetical protein [Streptomyces sp. NPDC058155]|uniref:SCO4402 family protein n=1 Tax=Streptomyces sp. NPDC058155 TaxID=3346359 RepID=UPI0036EC5166
MSVEYENMRLLLLEHLRKLSDPVWRRENWAQGRPPVESWGSFDDFLDFLYDDSGVLNDPEGSLGYVLKNDDEVSAISELRDSIDAGLSEGLDGEGDSLQHPGWEAITAAVQRAVRILTER